MEANQKRSLQTTGTRYVIQVNDTGVIVGTIGRHVPTLMSYVEQGMLFE